MEPLIGLAVLVTWLGIKVFAARRVVRGHHRFAWVFFAPALFGMVFVVSLAIRSFAAQPLLAIILGLVGIPSLVSLLRIYCEVGDTLVGQRSPMLLGPGPTRTGSPVRLPPPDDAFGAQGDSECACVPSVQKVTITFGRHARQLLDGLHTTPIVERSAAV